MSNNGDFKLVAMRHDSRSPVRFVMRAVVVTSLLVALAASGCAKRHAYPGDRKPDDRVAYIRSDRILFAQVDVRIDGKTVGPIDQYYIPPAAGDEFLGRPTTGVSVLPGAHDLSVRVAVYGWIAAARKTCARMTFTSQAGADYKLLFIGGDAVLQDMKTGDVLSRSSLEACAADERTKRA